MLELKERQGILEVVASGRVTSSEVERLRSYLDLCACHERSAPILCTLDDFWGLESREAWDNLRYWLRCLELPVRVGVVAEPKWLDLLRSGGFERPAGVRLRAFDPAHEAEARRWLGVGGRERPPAGSRPPRSRSDSTAAAEPAVVPDAESEPALDAVCAGSPP